MRIYKSNRLLRLLIYTSLFGFLLISVLLIFIFMKNSLRDYEDSLRNLKIQQLKRVKLQAADRIDKLVDFIHINEQLLYKEEKEKVKNSVNLGIEIISGVYEQYKHFSKDIIYGKIRDRLANVRIFDNKNGYFFVYDLDGNCIVLPSSPSLEGKNLIDLKDKRGDFVIRKAIKIVNSRGEGFISWYWYKIGEKEMKKKLGFIKLFKPLNIFIGTARYEEDIINNIKKDTVKYLKTLKDDDYGYIFAYDYKGNSLKEIEKYSNINRWNDIINGYHIVRDVIYGAQFIPNGFFYRYISKDYKNKISYIRAIPKFHWIVGTEVQDITKLYEHQKNILDKKLFKTISQTIWLSIFIMSIMMVGFLFISTKIKKLFNILEENIEQKNKKLIFQATHDSLTLLPNRNLLLDRIKHSLEKAQRSRDKVAVLFLDVDNFKMINDIYGHDIGDRLLQKIAAILKAQIRKSDTVARYGGDEFIILLDDLHEISDTVIIIKKIISKLQEPLYIQNNSFKVTCSIGVSMYPYDANDGNNLLKYADIAMYKAKSDGKNRYVFYNESMNNKIVEHLEMEKELRNAIDNDEFIIMFQPQIEVDSLKLVGLEALVRWNHPRLGMVFPDYFINVAEESNLIVEIGNIVLKKSLLQMKEWIKRGYDPGIVSINFASKQLEDERVFENFKRVLKETSCPANRVEVEIVERFLMKDIDKLVMMLTHFREIGVGIAIDDFGTGYSSLSYLKHLPVTKLKIDKSFIDGILNNRADRAIAKSIIDLSLGLNVRVLAEGVETREQYELLCDLGCQVIQGYYFLKPVSKDIIEKKFFINQKNSQTKST